MNCLLTKLSTVKYVTKFYHDGDTCLHLLIFIAVGLVYVYCAISQFERSDKSALYVIGPIYLGSNPY